MPREVLLALVGFWICLGYLCCLIAIGATRGSRQAIRRYRVQRELTAVARAKDREQREWRRAW
jgi:hypothetical protein